MQQLLLAADWQLKARDDRHALAAEFAGTAGWLPATVPGSVHQDLLAAGAIADPFPE